MTAKQIIKKIEKAGIDTKDISISGKNEIEIWTGNGNSSERLMKKVTKIVPLSGYRTGFGGWVLSESYTDKGDWNDKASRHHY